ncbi:hypothetical protein [Agrobacterium cavarae]|uniref:hypothetical protein n=1 Tax=Agrobacterium cavarae TaxID=2528239 RepID=UPI0013EF259E|nr:hypothetical protein [Agrobacterium cavarae]
MKEEQFSLLPAIHSGPSACYTKPASVDKSAVFRQAGLAANAVPDLSSFINREKKTAWRIKKTSSICT